jgi:hypothetical protein
VKTIARWRRTSAPASERVPVVPARHRASLRLVPAEQVGPAEVGHQLDEICVHPSDSAHRAEARPAGDPARGESGCGPVDLLQQATNGPPQALPYLARLEARFGRPLRHIRAHSGPAARAALEALGADAATLGNEVVLADSRPDFATVAHEVTHALQTGGGPTGAESPEVAAPDSAAEREAGRVAHDVIALPGGDTASAGLSAPLGPGTIALQRAGLAPREEGGVALLERPPDPLAPGLPERAATEPQFEGEPRAAATRGARVLEHEPGRETVPDAGGTVESELQLPPPPEPGVAAEDVALREGVLAQAEAALGAARDVPDLMAAFALAPPTVKAGRQERLGQEITDLAQQESQHYEEELPEFHATLSGEAKLPEPLSVESPAAREVVLEETAPPPAPDPDIPETPAPGHFAANDNVTRLINMFFAGADPAGRAEQIGDSLRDVRTTDPEIPRTPGPPPAVPLEGESDPERLVDQTAEGIAGARAARDEAQAAVLTGPGPEQSQPVQLDQAYAVGVLEQPVVEPVKPAEGAQEYLDKALPAEVQVAFDQQQQRPMQESMVGAVEQAEQAAAERDQARLSEVESTEVQVAELSRGADEQQRDHVREARAAIQDERQATLDAQSDAVRQTETSVEERRDQDRGAIEDRVTADQGLIQERYQAAETDVDDEIRQGEREAEEEKRSAEREAEEQSWWDRAVNFVRRAFSALVAAINTIFDAVRSAVNGILDAAKSFAMELIDAAAAFIKDAIGAFGEFLKFAVDGLLGDVFPGLAAALNEKIDGAVAAAQALVDEVAEGLKAGVAALIDGLKAGLNRILDAFQAGLNLAISFVEAALTGDWSALLRKLLEAVLKVIGVEPERFYAFVGRAEETFRIILDDPLGFLSNLIEGFLGGVRLFAGNILTHLQAGIIAWLTGTLGSAGLNLPERFDLMGVLSLAQQILGLTWQRLRAKAVRLIGEQNVARLEHVVSYLETLIKEGWAGLWQRIQSELATLRDTVLQQIKSFLVERVIMAAITKVATLFNPVGAIVQLVLAAWNLFTFLRDQLQRIFQVVQAVIDAIGDIARGILDPAKAKVEQVLAGLLPLALDLLARLLGLGNVGTKVREIVESVQQTIDRAIDRLIERVMAAFRGEGATATGTSPPAGAAPGAPDGGVIEESFRIIGERHTIRAVITEGQASLLMASETFHGIVAQMTQLLANLRRIYTGPGGYFHGKAQAQQLEQEFARIEDEGVALVRALDRENDPTRERRLAQEGVVRLRKMFDGLGLPEAGQAGPGIAPSHGIANELGTFGRARWFEVYPLSEASLGRGEPAEDDIPGIGVLPGYHKGHLVARSLGGPGGPANVVPMSRDANLTNIGMRRIERDLYEALQRTRGNPEAAPPFIFKYRVTAVYNPSGELQNELEQRVQAAPGSEARLFGLAARESRISDEQLMHELRNPELDSTDGSLRASQAANVRSRLAWHFMAHTFSVDAQVVQQPERDDLRPTISASKPVTNHPRASLEWRG